MTDYFYREEEGRIPLNIFVEFLRPVIKEERESEDANGASTSLLVSSRHPNSGAGPSTAHTDTKHRQSKLNAARSIEKQIDFEHQVLLDRLREAQERHEADKARLAQTATDDELRLVMRIAGLEGENSSSDEDDNFGEELFY